MHLPSKGLIFVGSDLISDFKMCHFIKEGAFLIKLHLICQLGGYSNTLLNWPTARIKTARILCVLSIIIFRRRREAICR